MTADSRPAPVPRMRISTSDMPIFLAFSPQDSPARVAANGVALRAPLKPMVPAESQQRVSPLVSVTVTMVLLCVALMWTMPRTTLRRTFFDFFAIYLALDALLAGDGLLASLAGASVASGALAAGWQAGAMAESAIRTDFAETLDVLCDLSLEGTFDDVVGVDGAGEGRDLLIVEITGLCVRVDADLEEDGCGELGSDAVHVLQGVVDLLVVRDINTGDTWHCETPLASSGRASRVLKTRC